MGTMAFLFAPSMSIEERRRKAQQFAEQIAKQLAVKAKPLAAVLCSGRTITCVVPNTPHYEEVVGWRHSMLIGMYTPDVDPARIARDVEETLAEYFDGCVIPKIVRA